MIVENLGMVNDAVHASSQANDMVLAATNLSTNEGASSFKGFTFDFDDNLVTIARTIGGLVGIAWIVFAIAKYAAPSSRGGGGSALQKIGGGGPLIAALLTVAMLLDINTTGKVINAFLRVGWSLFSLVSSGLPGS